MGPPEALILALQARMSLGVFVETGTFRGDTAAWAGGHFRRVVTIELSPDYHAAAVARFRGRDGIQALHGDSATRIREVVATLDGPALFWLDAHWSGLDTAGREAECPLLAEVAAINASPVGHVVMVDDARLFCAPPPRPHRAEQWPDLASTTTALTAGGRRHVVLVEDVFVAVPNEQRPFVDRWLQDAAEVPRRAGWLGRWRKRVGS